MRPYVSTSPSLTNRTAPHPHSNPRCAIVVSYCTQCTDFRRSRFVDFANGSSDAMNVCHDRTQHRLRSRHFHTTYRVPRQGMYDYVQAISCLVADIIPLGWLPTAGKRAAIAWLASRRPGGTDMSPSYSYALHIPPAS